MARYDANRDYYRGKPTPGREPLRVFKGVQVYANKYGGYEADIDGETVKYARWDGIRDAINRGDRAIAAVELTTSFGKPKKPIRVTVSEVTTRGELKNRRGHKVGDNYGRAVFHDDPHTVAILCDILAEIDSLVDEYQRELANMRRVRRDNLADGLNWRQAGALSANDESEGEDGE